ncbi:MAG TPA: DUF4012 domain-containing protein [Acidimicrobiales bacterium]|nr:DUF4012 domain-containing protein [Acidimicrobiales bacterium]
MSRRRRLVVRGVIVVIILWCIGAAVVIALGVVHAEHGMADIQEAKAHLSASDVVSRAATGPLRSAGRQFTSASGLLHSPLLAPLDIVPIIGRQLRSVQDLSSASAQVASIGVGAIGQAHAVLGDAHNTGPARVSELRALARLATTTNDALGRINTGPDQALLPPLGHKHDTFVADLDDVRTELSHASVVATQVATILQGPQTYLLAMTNNAEMRAGSGNFLEVGVLSTQDGKFTLSQVTPTAPIPVPPGEVTPTGDLAARWGWLKPGQDWRNLGLTPQFDVNGQLAAQMWQAEAGQHIDGVIEVDIEALHQFLEVTGPVTLDDGTTVGSDNVVQLLAHDQYEGLTDSTTNASQNIVQAERQERLGSLSHAVLDALENESLDLKELANAMTAATQGRHLMVWSRSAPAEAAWVEGGVSGELTASSTMAAVINRGGNKLDQYLSESVDLAIQSHAKSATGTLTVTLANHTPPGQSQFIAGPYPALGNVYGEYLGILAVNLPGFFYQPQVVGDPSIDALGGEGPTWVIATPVDVKAGATQRIVVSFTVPEAHGQLRVVPTARLTPVTWRYRGSEQTDAAPFTLSW